jgi:flagellin
MSFSIQTNVNSLVAQENLRVNSNFQSQTIQRLTSGYRINSSADDAAGLAIANKFRSDVNELAQGVRNANDGVSQLQIIDGGMSNIGKMLDRLKTLATQSASDSFTGSRIALNSEYQSLLGEIDRQAQGIGLGTNGQFAKSLAVYIGGGKTASGAADTTNGTVSVNLKSSTVDTQSLGLAGLSFKAAGTTGSDIGTSSTTSVSNILANTNNTTTATFNFNGPGFSGLSVSVNLTGVSGTSQLVTKINDAITAAGASGIAGADKFQAANISASVVTDSDGKHQLQFSSTSAAFDVVASNKTANALMGNYKTAAEGADVTPTVTGSGAVTAGADAASSVRMRFIVDGVASGWQAVGVNAVAATKITNVGTALTNAGVTTVTAAAAVGTGALQFTGQAGHTFEVEVDGDSANNFKLGTWNAEVAGAGAGKVCAAAGALGADGQTTILGFSVNGGSKVLLTVNNDTGANIVTAMTAAITGNATLAAAGVTVAFGGGAFTFNSAAGAALRVNVESITGAGTMDMGIAKSGTGVASAATTASLGNRLTTIAGGTSQTSLGASGDVFSFSALRNLGDSQSLSFSTSDAAGVLQSTSITLTTANALSIDKAITSINAQLQSDTNLKGVVAVKEMNAAGTAEGIRFLSKNTNFSVTVGAATNGTTANPVGMYDGTGATPKQGNIVSSSNAVNTAATDITTLTGAKAAVTALGDAVSKLGTAQAAVGKGQNQLSYAIGLAQSQINNFSSAQAQIRDADVASEAANLTKAQVLQQASIAAMAQANSAPQAVLSLLRG